MHWYYVAIFVFFYLWIATATVSFVNKQSNPEWRKGATETEKFSRRHLRWIFIVGVTPGLNMLGIGFYIPFIMIVAAHEMLIRGAVAMWRAYKSLFGKETKETK